MIKQKDFQVIYRRFFIQATGITEGPYPFQLRLAVQDPFPELLDVPTGLGKTAAVVLAWLWRRRCDVRYKDQTPRRLVYCLPMRVLVEQTHNNVKTWLQNLGQLGEEGSGKVSVHLLMGGEQDMKSWSEYPEEDLIIIGTQDMLLSRALMRGYGMSRYQWPMHFALLHNDAQWIFDEVQLMGAGLATSVQIDLFHKRFWKSAVNCRFLWMSATPGEGMFDTRDRRDIELHQLSKENILYIPLNAPERSASVLNAEKTIEVMGKQPKADSRDGIINRHENGRISLVVVNTVRNAQAIYRELEEAISIRKKKHLPRPELILLHGRMRLCDRHEQMKTVMDFTEKQKKNNGFVPEHPGLVIVATQVIEAGVDISASRLWSEIAPWSSVIHRLGRLNRDNHQPKAQAFFWMPKPDKEVENSTKETAPNAGRVGPYDSDNLKRAKELLDDLTKRLKSLMPYRQALDEVIQSISGQEAQRVFHVSVIRPKDFYELFSTEPDIAGGFTDISRFIRDQDNDSDSLVFWGNFNNMPSEKLDCNADILCRVPAYVLRKFLKDSKARAWVWNDESGRYDNVPDIKICPGMTVLLSNTDGGYSNALGWTGIKKDRPDGGMAQPSVPTQRNDDPWSETDWLNLFDHSNDTVREAQRIATSFDLKLAWSNAVCTAAAGHDAGKLHEKWQAPLVLKQPSPGPWAKFRRADVGVFRPRIRHEAASALLAWSLWLQGKASLSALAVYLIAAHHGKVRTVLRSTVDGKDVFGIRDRDKLPPFPNWNLEEVHLDLRPRIFGSAGYWINDSTYHIDTPSWVAVVTELLGGNLDGTDMSEVIPDDEPKALGPFSLALLEMILMVADHRASTAPSRGENHEQTT